MEERARIPVAPPVSIPLPSYWHTPKSPLTNSIKSEISSKVQQYDYVIIGSGISGTMIAHNLLQSKPGARVVMLEAREICSGATGRNGGHTKAASYRSYTHHAEELGREEALKIARLEYANIIETHALAKDMEIDCESQLCDTVDIIYDISAFEDGKTAIRALQADATQIENETKGLAWHEIHDKEEALERGLFVAPENDNPNLAEKEELAGVFRYLAGRVHAYRFTTGVLEDCVSKGLQLRINTPVHDVHPSLCKSDGASPLWDVFTHDSLITTNNVIFASNGYTPYLLNELQGAIVPMRGQITAQQPGKESTLQRPLSTTYSFIYRDGYEYMIPRPLPEGGQHIIIGGGLGRLPAGGANEFGTVDDSSLNPEISKYLHGTLPGFFGAENWGETSADEASKRVVQEWTGIMGATADGRPFVGEVPGKKGMWISAGFNGHGMVLCLKSAEALVDMIEDGSVDGKPKWFPESFLITEERLRKCAFRGRVDLL